MPEKAAADAASTGEAGHKTSVDQFVGIMERPGSDIAAMVAALPAGLDIPVSVQVDPAALWRFLTAIAEHAPVYRIYLTEKVLMVAPDIELVLSDIGLIELGLNSMDAAAVLTTVEAELNLEIPIDTITKGASLDDLALWLALRTALAEAGF